MGARVLVVIFVVVLAAEVVALMDTTVLEVTADVNSRGGSRLNS